MFKLRTSLLTFIHTNMEAMDFIKQVREYADKVKDFSFELEAALNVKESLAEEGNENEKYIASLKYVNQLEEMETILSNAPTFKLPY